MADGYGGQVKARTFEDEVREVLIEQRAQLVTRRNDLVATAETTYNANTQATKAISVLDPVLQALDRTLGGEDDAPRPAYAEYPMVSPEVAKRA